MTEDEAGSAVAQLSKGSAQRETSRTFVALGLLVIMAGGWLASENVRLRLAMFEKGSAEVSRDTTLQPGDMLPDVEVAELSGKSEARRLPGSLLGKLDGPAVLFFFTSTCPYCARSFPFARTLHEQLAGLSIQFVGIALDGRLPGTDSSGPAAVTYRALAPVDLATAKQLRVALVPTLLLIDREFVVSEAWTGELTASRVDEVARSVRGLRTPDD